MTTAPEKTVVMVVTFANSSCLVFNSDPQNFYR